MRFATYEVKDKMICFSKQNDDEPRDILGSDIIRIKKKENELPINLIFFSNEKARIEVIVDCELTNQGPSRGMSLLAGKFYTLYPDGKIEEMR